MYSKIVICYEGFSGPEIIEISGDIIDTFVSGPYSVDFDISKDTRRTIPASRIYNIDYTKS